MTGVYPGLILATYESPVRVWVWNYGSREKPKYRLPSLWLPNSKFQSMMTPEILSMFTTKNSEKLWKPLVQKKTRRAFSVDVPLVGDTDITIRYGVYLLPLSNMTQINIGTNVGTQLHMWITQPECEQYLPVPAVHAIGMALTVKIKDSWPRILRSCDRASTTEMKDNFGSTFQRDAMSKPITAADIAPFKNQDDDVFGEEQIPLSQRSSPAVVSAESHTYTTTTTTTAPRKNAQNAQNTQNTTNSETIHEVKRHDKLEGVGVYATRRILAGELILRESALAFGRHPPPRSLSDKKEETPVTPPIVDEALYLTEALLAQNLTCDEMEQKYHWKASASIIVPERSSACDSMLDRMEKTYKETKTSRRDIVRLWKLVSGYYHNCTGYVSQEAHGFAVFPTLGAFNHSCDFNAIHIIYADHVEIYATQIIEKGTEVTITYNLAARSLPYFLRENVLNQLAFHQRSMKSITECICSRCALERTQLYMTPFAPDPKLSRVEQLRIAQQESKMPSELAKQWMGIEGTLAPFMSMTREKDMIAGESDEDRHTRRAIDSVREAVKMLQAHDTHPMVYDFLLFQMMISLHSRASWLTIISKLYPKEKPMSKLVGYANDWIGILKSGKEKHFARWHLEQQVLFYLAWNTSHMQLQSLNLYKLVIQFEHDIHLDWSMVKCRKARFLELAKRCMKSECQHSYLSRLLVRVVSSANNTVKSL